MSPVRKLLEDLKRLRGAESVKINGMYADTMIEALANAILDLEARMKVTDKEVERIADAAWRRL